MLNTLEIEQLPEFVYQVSSKKFHLGSKIEDLFTYNAQV